MKCGVVLSRRCINRNSWLWNKTIIERNHQTKWNKGKKWTNTSYICACIKKPVSMVSKTWFTLNFVVTLNFCESAPPDLCSAPTTGFSDWLSMLDAKAWGRGHVQEERSSIESKWSKSLFFSRKPVVSYVTCHQKWSYWISTEENWLLKWMIHWNWRCWIMLIQFFF